MTSTGDDGTFDPKYIHDDSALFQALDDKSEMVSFGLDLSRSTSEALGDSIFQGLPYLFLILVMIGAQYLQQKQVSARNKDGELAMPQQKILLRVMPAVFGVISINFPAALVVYWVTSSIYRIGLQYYITKALYADDDSPGAQAQKAAAEARKLGKGGAGGKGGDKAGDSPKGGSTNGAKAGASGSGGGTGRTTPSGGDGGGGKYQPGSKKKKKRRR